MIAAYNYLEYRDDHSYGEIKALNLDTGEVRTLVGDRGVQLLRPMPSPDGRHVAFTSFPANLPYPEFWDIAVVPFEGGQVRRLTADIFVSSAPAWAPDGSSIYFRAKLGAFTQLLAVSLQGQVRQLTNGPRSVSSAAVAPDGRQVTWTTRDALGSSELRISRLDGAEERILEDFSPGLAKFELGEAGEIRWKSRDGLEIAGFLIRPPDFRPGRRYPLLVDLHGGPVGGASLNGSLLLTSTLEWHMWAARGFLVLAADYRSSGVYGWDRIVEARDRQDANHRDLDDIMSGVDHLIAQGMVDPDRLAVLGHSYGGYMTNWLITQTPRFKAAVSYEGYADNFYAYGTGYTTGGNRVQEWLFKGKPWEVPENYRRSSPSEFVVRIQTPTLFVSGAEGGLPLFHNEFMYTALRQQGIPTRLLVYMDEGHVVRKPGNESHLLHEAIEWIERFVRP